MPTHTHSRAIQSSAFPRLSWPGHSPGRARTMSFWQPRGQTTPGRCRGTILPPGPTRHKLQALTGFLEPGLGLKLARLTLGSERSSSRARFAPLPLMAAPCQGRPRGSRPAAPLYGSAVNRARRACPAVSRSRRGGPSALAGRSSELQWLGKGSSLVLVFQHLLFY